MVGAVVAAAALALAWAGGDEVVRGALVIAAAAAAPLVVRRARRRRSPHDVYLRALQRASGMRVELLSARVLAVHESHTPTLVSVGWRAARTTLVDADGRALAALERNGLTTAYTWSVPVRDLDVADALGADHGLGTVVVHATTDLFHHPDGCVARDGVVVDQVDLAFPSWSGSVLAVRTPSRWEP